MPGMTTPRRLLVDPVNACDYHLVSRCVQQAFLFGRDPATGRDNSHRKQWLVDRLELLACCFAVEIYAYCIMSNHFHLIARYDPLACWGWSDEEVARRWVDAFPPTKKGKVLEERKPEARELLLGSPNRLLRARRTLGSLSDFMKHLKQPIARRANLESGTSGHAWDQRYYSAALLTEAALLAAMAYVDLNPVRARIAQRIEQCRHTSIAERVRENSAEALEAYLAPLVSGLAEPDSDVAENAPKSEPGHIDTARGRPTSAPAGNHASRIRGHGAWHGGRRGDTLASANQPVGPVAGPDGRARQTATCLRIRGATGKLDTPARTPTEGDTPAGVTARHCSRRSGGLDPHRVSRQPRVG